jgi:hypothetical protein
MRDPLADVADLICQHLTFCYSDEHRESLRSKAAEDGATLEQVVAAAITQQISERFEVLRKTSLN